MATQNAITLTVGQLRGIILASATKDIRYYLNGSLFDFEKGRVVSTDGTCLLMVNVESNLADVAYGSVIIDRADLEVIAKGGKVTDTVMIYYGNEVLSLHRGNGITVTATPIDGKYPDYECIIPKNISGETAQYNPDLVARICKALSLACELSRNAKSMPAIGYNGMSAALVAMAGYGDRAIAVVMPMRNDTSTEAELLAFRDVGSERKTA